MIARMTQPIAILPRSPANDTPSARGIRADAGAQPCGDVLDLRPADLVLHRVFLPVDAVARGAQPVAGHDAERERQHRVVLAVAHQDRRLPGGLGKPARSCRLAMSGSGLRVESCHLTW